MSSRREDIKARLKEKAEKQAAEKGQTLVTSLTTLKEKESSYQDKSFNQLKMKERLQFLQEAVALVEKIVALVKTASVYALEGGKPVTETYALYKQGHWLVRLSEEYLAQEMKVEGLHCAKQAEECKHPYASVILGRLAMNQGDRKNAGKYCHLAIKDIPHNTNIDSFYLGRAYFYLAQIELNEAHFLEAITYLMKAPSPYTLGEAYLALAHFYYRHGTVVKKNEVTPLLEKAMQLNVWRAYQMKVEIIRTTQELTETNFLEIERLLKTACRLTKDPLPHFYLGQIYDVIGKKNLAVQKYKDAGKHYESMKNLAISHQRGEGTPANPKAALALFKELYEEHGSAEAATEYGILLSEQTNAGSQKEIKKALRFGMSKKVASAYHAVGCLILRNQWQTEQPHTDMLRYFLKGAKLGYWFSQINYLVHIVPMQEYKQALAWAQQLSLNETVDWDMAIAIIKDNIINYIHTYQEFPSAGLRQDIEFLVTKILPLFEGAKKPEAPLTPGLLPLEDITKITSDTEIDIPAVSALFSRLLPEFHGTTHQQFKALNRQLVRTAHSTVHTPFYKIQQLIEDITEAGDADFINLSIALQKLSEVVSANRYDSQLIAFHYPGLMKVYQLLANPPQTAISPKFLLSALPSLAQLSLATAVHDAEPCLNWLVPQVITAFVQDPQVKNTLALLRALYRLAKTNVVRQYDLSLFLNAVGTLALTMSGDQLAANCYALAVLHRQCRFADTVNASLINTTLLKISAHACEQIDAATLTVSNRHAWALVLSYLQKHCALHSTQVQKHIAYFKNKPAYLLVANRVRSSHLQMEIADFLSPYFRIAEEYPMQGLLVDIYLEDFRLVIQVDGPGHFLYDPHNIGKEHSAKDEFRDSLLERVVHISYCEWDACETEQDKARLFKAKLFAFKIPLPATLTALCEATTLDLLVTDYYGGLKL
jgi:tetratricopeptide (TPR) repeat protein